MARTARREVRLDQVTTGTFRPRRSQDSFLDQLAQQHLETFLATHREACQDDDPTPVYVERAFRSILECGIPASRFLLHRSFCGVGFARARCAACKHDFVVPFSCKTRGLCQSCNTRRMVETADQVEFYPASELTPEVVQKLQQTFRKRILGYLERHGRLEPVDEQTVAYEMLKPTRDGRTCLFMDPLELVARLAALIPPPRDHLVPFALECAQDCLSDS